jgi:hypothetical protein
MLVQNSYLDELYGIVLPDDSGTWDDLNTRTWDTWTEWFVTPEQELIWQIGPVDLADPKTFNLKIIGIASGTVEYEISTSNTGAFAGEETTTLIETNDTGVGGFSGRYFIIMVKVIATGGAPILQGVEYAVSETANTLSLNNIDTATLPGTSASRTLTLPKPIGAITNIQITPQAVSSYALDLYVSSTPTSTTVMPRVISKTSTPQFALVGLDNKPRDAVVDIVIEYLAEGYMNGNNLLVR